MTRNNLDCCLEIIFLYFCYFFENGSNYYLPLNWEYMYNGFRFINWNSKKEKVNKSESVKEVKWPSSLIVADFLG